MLDPEIVKAKRELRLSNIKEMAKNDNLPENMAAIVWDMKADQTTNRQMFGEAGYILPYPITEENNMDILQAFTDLGITVCFKKKLEPKELCVILTSIVDEIITECWGGVGVEEIIEI